MTLDENLSKYRVNALPKNWRHLRWNNNETYQSHMNLNIDILLKKCLNLFLQSWEINILDIWWFNSPAITEMKEELVKMWIPKNKINLCKIDINNICEDWVNFTQWDLNSIDFLKSLERIYSNWRFQIIFMNQVTQYIENRLLVIKFITERLLSVWWFFNFNLVLSSFYTWKIPPSIFREELIKLMLNDTQWIKIDIRNWQNNDVTNFEIVKNDTNWKIEFPSFWRVYQDRNDWFKISSYNFWWRIELPISYHTSKQLEIFTKKQQIYFKILVVFLYIIRFLNILIINI